MFSNTKLCFNNQKHEVWWRLLREIADFFSKKGFIELENFKKISDYLEISKYEIFLERKEEGDLFDAFVDAVMSKSACFKNEWIVNSLRKITFEHNYCSLFLKDTNDYLLELLNNVSKLLKRLSTEYSDLIQVGRTHGVHAEPISFGYKFSLCYLDLERNIEALKQIRKDIEIAWIDLLSFEDSQITVQLRRHISDTFSLFIKSGNCLYLPYAQYSIYLSYINSTALDISKLLLDLHFLNSEEVGEIDSAKFKNSFEKIEKLCRGIVQNVNAYNDCLKKHSRLPIFEENSEWFHLEKATKDFVVLLEEFAPLLESIVPNKESLRENLMTSKSRIFSQSAMTHAIKSSNLNRQQVLTDMKYMSSVSSKQNKDFKDVVLESPQYKRLFSSQEGKNVFSYEEYLKNIDVLQLRIFQDEAFDPDDRIVGLEFDRLNLLANKLNVEYKREISPVILVSFEDKSTTFLGLLLEKLKFPVKSVVFSNLKNDLEIDSLEFDHDLFISKKILVIDFGVDKEFDLLGFCKKLRESVFIKELKQCKEFVN